MTRPEPHRETLHAIDLSRRLIADIARDLDYCDPLSAVMAAAARIAEIQWLAEYDRVKAMEASAERRAAALLAHEAAIYAVAGGAV